ncbi:MAG: efflux RND transporter periplasmic adaptor subunit [Chitinophagaceae bacterium]
MNFTPYLKRFLPIFLMATVAISCNSKRKAEAQAAQKNANKPKPIPRVDGYVVHTKTLFDNIEISGTIVANETTEIHPEVSGLLKNIYFKEGAFVGKGAMLAKINDADLQAQRNKLAVQLKIAQQNENRSSQLLNIQGISRQDYEMSLLQVNNIKADLSIINTSIAKTQIRAPFSGKLGLRVISPGAYVSPQSILTTISQMSGLKIDFTIPEKYSSKLSIGQYVNFTTDGSDRAYTARIAATDPGVSQNTRSLLVRATVQGDQTGLRPGNFAKVILQFQPNKEAIVVPSQAIIPQARGKKVYVFENGKAKFVSVETGIRDSATVQITNGLKPGDTVLVTGLLALKPDASVTINKIVN